MLSANYQGCSLDTRCLGFCWGHRPALPIMLQNAPKLWYWMWITSYEQLRYNEALGSFGNHDYILKAMVPGSSQEVRLHSCLHDKSEQNEAAWPSESDSLLRDRQSSHLHPSSIQQLLRTLQRPDTGDKADGNRCDSIIPLPLWSSECSAGRTMNTHKNKRQ